VKTKHIKLFEHFNKEKKFYHASCEDFSNFNHNVYYFSQTKKDCLHFHKNWRKCSDNKPTILYECLIDLGKNFNPKNLKDYEINSIKELISINKNKKLKDGLWGVLSENKDLDYPELSDFEYTMFVLKGVENWHMIEQPYFIKWLREEKYDTFFIDEYDFKDDNIGVLNNNNITILEKNII
jgi:hypothetical protein